MKIKFQSVEGDKFFRYDKYEFHATRQTQGYSLVVYEWYYVEDNYIANKCFSRRVPITWEMPSNIDRIRERIVEFISK